MLAPLGDVGARTAGKGWVVGLERCTTGGNLSRDPTLLRAPASVAPCPPASCRLTRPALLCAQSLPQLAPAGTKLQGSGLGRWCLCDRNLGVKGKVAMDSWVPHVVSPDTLYPFLSSSFSPFGLPCSYGVGEVLQQGVLWPSFLGHLFRLHLLSNPSLPPPGLTNFWQFLG